MKEISDYITGTIDVLRARGELRRYSEIDPGTPTTLFETFMLYCIRRQFEIPKDRIAEHFIPSTLAGVRQLFEAYDDVADGASALPDISAIKTHEGLQQKLQNVIEVIMSAPIQRHQRRQIMGIINQERQLQYSLEQRYGQHTQPLSSAEAILWREQSGGSFFSLFPRIAGIQLGIDSRSSEPMINAAYLYGANLQLLDDLVDIEEDIGDRRQNAFISSLLELPNEYQEVQKRINGSPHTLSFQQLRESAPRSLRTIEDARAGYHQRIADEARLPIFDLICDTRNTPLVMNQYRLRTSYK